MTCARLYGTPGVLALWAMLWTVGVRGDVVIVVGLSLTAVAVVFAVRELVARVRRLRA